MRTKGPIIAGVVLLLGATFLSGVYAGITERAAWAQSNTSTVNLRFINQTQPSDVDMAQFWKAWHVLEENYIQSNASGTVPTTEERLWGAIEGLAASYGDPYTVFLPPEDAKIFNEDVSGSFGGVGMELGRNDKGQLIVVAPLKGSPAEAAGIKSRDIILAVGTTSTESMPVEQAVKIIRGPKGTTVKLTVLHPGSTDPTTISIVRDTIVVPVIDTKIEGDVFVISLYSFSETSLNAFRGALRQYFESGKTKLVLDLRGNPGGYLEAAVQMASYFLPVGDVVVTEDYRGKRDNVPHRSVGYNVFQNKKLSMAVLVDQGSASASEILAGALQQHGVAKLVGTPTFGKGSVQQLIDIGDGGEIKVTVARWLTPNGSSISDGGLKPDIKAERTEADRGKGTDPQMSAALSWLATQ